MGRVLDSLEIHVVDEACHVRHVTRAQNHLRRDLGRDAALSGVPLARDQFQLK